MKKQFRKSSLSSLKVESFVTSINSKKSQTVKGGSDYSIIDIPDEPTGLGASCEWTMCATHECPAV